MKLRLLSTICVMGAVLSGCASMGETQLTNKEKATAVLNNIGTADRSYLGHISDDTYIQHNPGIASTKAGLVAYLEPFPTMPKNTDGNVVRALQDGDYVVLHSDMKAFHAALFDIFRFEDGLIVEHWDNMQTQGKPNPSGRTLTDGATQIVDLDKTQQNKILVKNLVQNVFIDGQFNKITQYISQDTYIQHNPWIGDGLNALGEAFAAMAARGETVKFEKIHAVLGEGNFVLTVGEGEFNGSPTSFYDLFRVENGKVVEHWDILQGITPKDKQANNNGQFNFPASAISLSK